MTSLLERLGHGDDAKVLLITCEGLGSSNAANIGTLVAMRNGVASSAGLQVPCPWARPAAQQHRGDDVGVALTCIAEHETYRWGPITHAPSLLDGDGGFPRTVTDLGEHADLDELRRECRAQIERAILWGFDPTHLSAHRDALCLRPELFDVFLDLAVEFSLPISLPDPSLDVGFPARELAAEEGILVADHVVAAPPGGEVRELADQLVADLPVGVTELRVRPAADTPELRAISAFWQQRVADAHLVSDDWSFRSALARSGASVIGYRSLRSAQRQADLPSAS